MKFTGVSSYDTEKMPHAVKSPQFCIMQNWGDLSEREVPFAFADKTSSFTDRIMITRAAP